MSDGIRELFQKDKDCPELEQLLDALRQDPADQRRLDAERHLHGCLHCQTEWRMFRQFEAGEVRPEERDAVEFIVGKGQQQRAAIRRAEPEERSPSFWRRFLTPSWMGAAAVAVATLVIAIGITSQWRARHSTPLEYGDNQTLRSQLLEITTPLSGIQEPPPHIEWKKIHGAASYSISIKEVDGAQVFYTKVTESTLSLPAPIRKLLAQGRTLLLSVTASDPSAREIARSGIVKIRLKTN